MRERATLRLDDGAEVRVEVDRDDLDRDEIVVHRTDAEPAKSSDELIAWMDKYLATAKRHPAGTTDRFLAADRQRAY
jgi:hypothetical protein